MPPDAYAIAASGMAAQQTQMDLIAANLANVATTRTAGGGPYHARTAVLEAASPFADALQNPQFPEALQNSQFPSAGPDRFLPTASMETNSVLDEEDIFDNQMWLQQPPGVQVAEVVEQAHNSPPGSQSQADVDPIEQMVALVAAGRGYDANVAVLQAAKQMDLEASDISRFA